MFDTVSKHPATDSVKRSSPFTNVDLMSSHRLIHANNSTFARRIEG